MTHWSRATHQEAPSAGIWLPGWVWVGSGVSEVLAAFVTSLATHQLFAPAYRVGYLRRNPCTAVVLAAMLRSWLHSGRERACVLDPNREYNLIRLLFAS
jgi:hypothetical protein